MIVSTKVYGTGEIAKLLHVAPRTVSKWFDKGRLQGYRLPGSGDRRITRKSLEQFIRDNQFPFELAPDRPSVYVLGNHQLAAQLLNQPAMRGYIVRQVANIWELAIAVDKLLPACVVVDGALGSAVLGEVAGQATKVPLVGICPDDRDSLPGAYLSVRAGAGPEELAKVVRECVETVGVKQ